MILGKPIDIENYVCVNSDISKILHKIGYIPIYREIDVDNIYYLKNKYIESKIKEVSNGLR